jgi:hypothetical protein
MIAGADQYLMKPAKPLILAAAIEQAISLSSEERWQRMRALAEPVDEGA